MAPKHAGLPERKNGGPIMCRTWLCVCIGMRHVTNGHQSRPVPDWQLLTRIIERNRLGRWNEHSVQPTLIKCTVK